MKISAIHLIYGDGIEHKTFWLWICNYHYTKDSILMLITDTKAKHVYMYIYWNPTQLIYKQILQPGTFLNKLENIWNAKLSIIYNFLDFRPES